MIRMVAEVAECTGTFGDTPATAGMAHSDKHWCEQCRGTGWVVVGEPFQLNWVPHRWPWPFWSHGTWRSILQVKRHVEES